MIHSLLIANRGEIACRIIRTARAMGIRTVAVYSDADAKALHVRQADEAVHIGPSPARDSYLVGDAIITAALSTGAQAVHPGYGFLSENAAFAQSVIDAGLIWVGPTPASITAMGLKDAAKALMIGAGVPVTPGYLGEDQNPDRLRAEAEAIGYPVLIKAVAGGGGKGMRRVDAAQQFDELLLSCKREAASSFGDDRVLIEKYILSPRHIEVQVFGDLYGNVVHLFERDCSLQRRHQKVIEEAPAPGMDEATRAAICAVAVKAAEAVGYVGAGTIEFIADASYGLHADRIWFMEMNTRLQVEHPVTEAITGVDLVEWQLRVASGEPLPRRQDELVIDGWAIEARLYAEDPANGFLPSVGTLDVFRPPFHDVRVETGVDAGDAISPYYDPMIAKLIAHGRNRRAATRILAEALDGLYAGPVKTNCWFLARLLALTGFQEGVATTGEIAAFHDELTAPPVPSQAACNTALDALMPHLGDRDGLLIGGFRLNAEPRRTAPLMANGAVVSGEVNSDEAGLSHLCRKDDIWIVEEGQSFCFSPFASRGAAAGAAGDGVILSPMPGRIIAVDVTPGATVAKGDRLVTLEAMKMEHSLVAPFAGTVAELVATAGAQVSEGTLLVRIEAANETA